MAKKKASVNIPEGLVDYYVMYSLDKNTGTKKTEDRRKEYDMILDAAYNAGKIDIAAQTVAKDLYEELN